MMDVKVSRKEQRYQQQGKVEVLVDDIFDFFPLYDNPDAPDMITDIEILDSPQEEQLDRAMFAIVKQRGLDPLLLDDGIQWAEHILGEVSAPVIIAQLQEAVFKEGPGVRITPRVTAQGTSFTLSITNARRAPTSMF